MQFEEEIVVDAPPTMVFSLYADVAAWKEWDPEVVESSIDGEFKAGSSGSLKPLKGPEAKITFTDVVKNASFTVQSRLPLCVMRFEHELAPDGSGTRVIHRVSFKGLLSPLFGRVIGAQIRRGLPGTLRGLKDAAEASAG